MDEVERLLLDKLSGKNDLPLSAIAHELGRSYDSVRWQWRRLKYEGPEPGTKRPTQPASIDSFMPVRPVKVEVPETKPKARAIEVPSGTFTSLHYGDVHFPFQDDRALEVLYAIIEDLQPNLIVNHGDLVDAYLISRFEKDPSHRISLQNELEMAASHLGTVRNLSPESECWLVEGNHEDRLRRQLWKMAESAPNREIVLLPTIQSALEWESLLGLNDLDWDYIREKRVLFDRLVIKHGTMVRKWSSYTARGEWEKYGKGGISGHTHRMGAFYHRDLSGSDVWLEHGCLCDLDPDYAESPDWQQGFVVVSWNEDRSLFGTEPVHIHEGRAFFRGREYGQP